MSTIKKIGSIILCFVFCMTIAGCSSNKDPLAGTWSIDKASIASSVSEEAVGKEFDRSELLDKLKITQMSMTFKDGKVDMLFGETESEGTYTLKDGVVTIEGTESEGKLEGKLEGDTLTLEKDTGKLIFKKQ